MKTIKFFINVFTVVVILASVSAKAQEKPDTSDSSHKMMMKHDNPKMHNMMHDSSNHHNMQGMNMSKDSSHYKMDNEMMSSKKSPLIREGVIDVKAIDKNKDGKVYEDMMDYNVISDKPGVCPLCGMTLKEVSVKKAEQNLKASGFKVK
jgi:hypothetical protein